jgi:hypothetical protein
MENASVHEFKLYTPEAFRAMLEHEVNKSHRYGDSLTLVDLIVEVDPASPENQNSAEALAIKALHMHLRNTDVPCKKDNKFLILMPATAAPGARTACERMKKIITASPQADDAVSFELRVFIGMATLLNDDRSVSGDRLAMSASQALQHAQTNQLTSVVSFSDLIK